MKSLALVLSTAACAAMLASVPAHGGGTICSLPAGSDFFTDSEGVGVLPVPGFGFIPFAACGPTIVTRGEPVAGPGPSQCTIPTEIVAMTLMGVAAPCDPMFPFLPGPNLPLLIIEDPGVASTGAVLSDSTGGLPATSFFDVATLVTVGAGPPFPYVVHVVADTLRGVPPGSATPGGPPCLQPGEDAYEAGYPLHEHRPCPQKICCQLPCGVRMHLSCHACREIFNGECYEGDCPFLCASQAVEKGTWGRVKSIYRD